MLNVVEIYSTSDQHKMKLVIRLINSFDFSMVFYTTVDADA